MYSSFATSSRTQLLGAIVLGLLFGVVAFQTPGYDDEFTNIELVESFRRDPWALLRLVNGQDVHPPGSYLINWALLRMTGDWRWVRVCTALFSAIALWLFYRRFAASDFATRRIGFVTIALNPSVLLWTASVRWYAYFTPLLLLIVTNLRREDTALRYYVVAWFGLALLFHIGYAALVLAPALVAFALTQRRTCLRDDFPIAIGVAIAAAAACLPQLLVFLRVHLPNYDTQTSSIAVAVFGFLLNWFCGQAAFPLSPPSVALILANGLIVTLLLLRRVRVNPQAPEALLGTGSAMFVLAHLSGKFRNLVLLNPFQSLMQARVTAASSAAVRHLLFMLLLIGNVWGVVNVVTHNETTKGSWNTPYHEALAAASQDSAGCTRRIALSTDPVLRYYLRHAGWIAAIPRSGESPTVAHPIGGNDCVTVFETFRGSTSHGDYARLITAFEQLPAREVLRHNIGPDRYSWLKRRIDPDVPKFYVVEIHYRDLVHPEVISSSWQW